LIEVVQAEGIIDRVILLTHVRHTLDTR
jgi:hypothetical protein